MVNKIDLDKPIQTVDGRKARVLCTDLASGCYTVAVAITNEEGVESVRTYTDEGGGIVQTGAVMAATS